MSTLEVELKEEKNNVKVQTEKLNTLKNQYAMLNVMIKTQEKENEIIIHKLS